MMVTILWRAAASCGSSGREKRMKPYVPIFSKTPARMTEPAVGASVCASGSQVWNGNIGTLIAKAKKKRPEEQHLRLHVETARRDASSVGISNVPPSGLEIKRQNAQQHDHRADQRVQEKFDRGVQAAVAAPDADQEIHRHQHHFPEHIEEEEIERHENAQHADLQQQEQNVIFLGANLDGAPGGKDRNSAEERRQDHQQEADAVDAQRVVRADGGNPVGVFAELVARRGRVQAEAPEQRQRDDQPEEARKDCR